MPEKILRLGMTECSLLFIYWLNKYINFYDINTTNTKNLLVKWLYTTSGYYDKTQIGSYFNVIHKEKDPEIYLKYMETIYSIIKNSDIFSFSPHKCSNEKLLSEFRDSIGAKKICYINQNIVFDFIKNKKILIISSFAPLIKSQLENGNCKKIYHLTPDIVKISIYRFPYTFFNSGPDNNIFQSSERFFKDIINSVDTSEFESVLISCGAYGCLIAQKFFELDKNVCVIGGDLQTFFGILNTRTKNNFEKNGTEIKNKEFWITKIPDEYKPKDYMKIENGCYW